MTSREFVYMNKSVFTSVSNFRKIGIATKRLYACNPLCTTRTFYPQISGSDMVSTTDKTFGPFSEWDFSPKKTFPRRVFSSQNVNKENSSGNFTCLRYCAFTYSPLYLTHKLTLVLL